MSDIQTIERQTYIGICRQIVQGVGIIWWEHTYYISGLIFCQQSDQQRGNNKYTLVSVDWEQKKIILNCFSHGYFGYISFFSHFG